MDLLLKNPRYFFETYFDFDPAEWLPVCLLLLAAGGIWILVKRPGRSERIAVLLHALYGALVLGVTVLNHSRVETQSILLDPRPMLRRLLTPDRVHVIRATLSNMIFFVPVGVFSALKAKKNSCLRAVIVGFLFSCFVEAMQYFCRRGTFESLDIICNVLGAWLGAVFMQIVLTLWRQLMRRIKRRS